MGGRPDELVDGSGRRFLLTEAFGCVAADEFRVVRANFQEDTWLGEPRRLPDLVYTHHGLHVPLRCLGPRARVGEELPAAIRTSGGIGNPTAGQSWLVIPVFERHLQACLTTTPCPDAMEHVWP